MTQDHYSEYGELDRSDGRATVRFTRRLPHAPAKVWRALTEPEHLEAWFPTTIDGQRAAGAKLSFAFRDLDMPSLDGQMLVYDPPAQVAEAHWNEEAKALIAGLILYIVAQELPGRRSLATLRDSG